MSAGNPVARMRHRLTLETPVDVSDDNGGVNRSWVAGGRLWASIEPVSMARRFEAAREEQVVTHHILFRYRDDMNATMRLRKADRVFRILAIENVDQTARFMRARCEEIKP